MLRKSLILAVLVLFLTSLSARATTYVFGEDGTNQDLTGSGGPGTSWPATHTYIIAGDCYIPDNATLTLLSGVTVQFDHDYAGDITSYPTIDVRGTLVCVGISSSYVRFTNYGGATTRGLFEGLRANATTSTYEGTISADYTIFEYGGRTNGIITATADAVLDLNECYVRFSDNDGISLSQACGNVTLTDCKVDSSDRDGIYQPSVSTYYSDVLTISGGAVIFNNRYGVVLGGGRTADVEGSIIRNNGVGGIYAYGFINGGYVRNCIITENPVNGIVFASSSYTRNAEGDVQSQYLRVLNNIIYNNGGNGIKIEDLNGFDADGEHYHVDIRMQNNTIWHNGVMQAEGNGLLVNGWFDDWGEDWPDILTMPDDPYLTLRSNLFGDNDDFEIATDDNDNQSNVPQLNGFKPSGGLFDGCDNGDNPIVHGVNDALITLANETVNTWDFHQKLNLANSAINVDDVSYWEVEDDDAYWTNWDAVEELPIPGRADFPTSSYGDLGAFGGIWSNNWPDIEWTFELTPYVVLGPGNFDLEAGDDGWANPESVVSYTIPAGRYRMYQSYDVPQYNEYHIETVADEIVIGAYFELMGAYSFTVRGWLVAHGQSNAPVAFVRNEGVEAWNGLQCNTTSTIDTELDYVYVSGVDGGSNGGIGLVGIEATQMNSGETQARIFDCHVQECAAYGFKSSTSSTYFKRCSSEWNGDGGFFISAGDQVTLQGCSTWVNDDEQANSAGIYVIQGAPYFAPWDGVGDNVTNHLLNDQRYGLYINSCDALALGADGIEGERSALCIEDCIASAIYITNACSPDFDYAYGCFDVMNGPNPAIGQYLVEWGTGNSFFPAQGNCWAGGADPEANEDDFFELPASIDYDNWLDECPCPDNVDDFEIARQLIREQNFVKAIPHLEKVAEIPGGEYFESAGRLLRKCYLNAGLDLNTLDAFYDEMAYVHQNDGLKLKAITLKAQLQTYLHKPTAGVKLLESIRSDFGNTIDSLDNEINILLIEMVDDDESDLASTATDPGLRIYAIESQIAELLDSQPDGARPIVPEKFTMSTAYPNPFNSTALVEYALPSNGRVSAMLFDLNGKELVRLLDEDQTIGTHKLTVNGAGLATGVYVLRMQHGAETSEQRIVLIK